MSRKFMIAVLGLVITVIALGYNNTVIALAGIALAGCFIIGESIVDAVASVKKSMVVHDTKQSYTAVTKDIVDTPSEENE